MSAEVRSRWGKRKPRSLPGGRAAWLACGSAHWYRAEKVFLGKCINQSWAGWSEIELHLCLKKGRAGGGTGDLVSLFKSSSCPLLVYDLMKVLWFHRARFSWERDVWTEGLGSQVWRE